MREQEEYLDRTYLGRHAGETVVIVAGGPSVADAKLTSALSGSIIAVNLVNSDEQFKEIRKRCVAGVVLDEALLLLHMRALASGAYPLFVGNTPHDSAALFKYLRAFGIERVPTNNTSGIGDTFARFGNGGHSGFGALQIAVLMGFTTIGLLGFDGVVEKQPLRYHRQYDYTNAAIIQKWCSDLDAYAPLVEYMGVKVLNLSPISELSAYEKVSVSKWNRLSLAKKAKSKTIVSTAGPTLPREWGPLLFTPGRLDAEYEEQHCFGGAVNAVSGRRYSPVPSTAEERMVERQDGSWWIVEQKADLDRGLCGEFKPALTVSLSCSESGGMEPTPPDYEEWLLGALQVIGRRPIKSLSLDSALAHWRNRIISNVALVVTADHHSLERRLTEMSLLSLRDVIVVIRFYTLPHGPEPKPAVTVSKIAAFVHICEYEQIGHCLCVVGVRAGNSQRGAFA